MLSLRDVGNNEGEDTMRELAERAAALRRRRAAEAEREQRQLFGESSLSTQEVEQLSRDLIASFVQSYPTLTLKHAPAAHVDAAAGWWPLGSMMSIAYPRLWCVPADLLPRSRILAVEARHDHPNAPPHAQADCRCLVHVKREALRWVSMGFDQRPAAGDASVGSPGSPMGAMQKVLARWPGCGSALQTKLAAVQRSMEIEEQKREQWNDHVRKYQNNDNQGRCTSPSALSGSTSRRGSTDHTARTHSDGTGSGAAAEILYWPAVVKRVYGRFSGELFENSFRALGLLQQYDVFEDALAIALRSPMQLFVDVVFTVDEVSEAHQLRIDPGVRYATAGSADNEIRTMVEEVYREVDAAEAEAWKVQQLADGRCPLLRADTLPDLISIYNYSYDAAPPRGGAESKANRRGTLNGTTLSTSPICVADLLVGPVFHTQSIVFLRPTTAVVVEAQRLAVADLEQLWTRLRQALLDRITAYEEQLPTLRAVEEHLPTLWAVEVMDPVLVEKPQPALQLPDAEEYKSPYVMDDTCQADDLPPEHSPMEMSEEDIRALTRMPQLQSHNTSDLGWGQPPIVSRLFEPREGIERARGRSSPYRGGDGASILRSDLPSGIDATVMSWEGTLASSRERTTLGADGESLQLGSSPAYTPRPTTAALTAELCVRPSDGRRGSLERLTPPGELSVPTPARAADATPATPPRDMPTEMSRYIAAGSVARLDDGTDITATARRLSAQVRASVQRRYHMESELMEQSRLSAEPRAALPALLVEARLMVRTDDEALTESSHPREGSTATRRPSADGGRHHDRSRTSSREAVAARATTPTPQTAPKPQNPATTPRLPNSSEKTATAAPVRRVEVAPPAGSVQPRPAPRSHTPLGSWQRTSQPQPSPLPIKPSTYVSTATAVPAKKARDAMPIGVGSARVSGTQTAAPVAATNAAMVGGHGPRQPPPPRPSGGPITPGRPAATVPSTESTAAATSFRAAPRMTMPTSVRPHGFPPPPLQRDKLISPPPRGRHNPSPPIEYSASHSGSRRGSDATWMYVNGPDVELQHTLRGNELDIRSPSPQVRWSIKPHPNQQQQLPRGSRITTHLISHMQNSRDSSYSDSSSSSDSVVGRRTTHTCREVVLEEAGWRGTRHRVRVCRRHHRRSSTGDTDGERTHTHRRRHHRTHRESSTAKDEGGRPSTRHHRRHH